ncbi:tRNA 2-thiouridine(34) synthase MnmA [Campylobacter porcelli]|uniref:tRNA-specific 2-thiouridylase MnmA n=1 Tax=Campylobacter porcelli TaxID=1660073 RepID=A0A1X9SY33_9BACT|nr:tRNA 2-thiouridine(34) synthase MnmA [Campylobacter sp. RM6137]ARR01178.1 tRNA U34 2-thiouridylase [Campylobacter sp. RM6137]
MKVLMALSGGVDSSMSAKFLQDQGYSVVGCYMMLHGREDYHKKNIENVKKVGEFLGIDTHVLDLQDTFKKEVYDLFVNSYKDGITPNPCAHCNRLIKFGALWEFAKSLGCDKIATGHYARIDNGLIKSAADESKDQSYFLANLDPKILSYIIFPLGDKFKVDIKAAAAQIPQISSLATQKESSEICFVETTYIDVLKQHYNTNLPGIVRNANGEAIGTHEGYMHYTIGKRKGFKITGAHDPHYVTAINASANEIIVGKKDDLECYSFKTRNFNNFTQQNDFDALVKIRYRSKPIPCVVHESNGVATVELKDNAGAVASGQLAVFYDDNQRVLASGFIA